MINIVILDYSDYSDFKGRGRMLFFYKLHFKGRGRMLFFLQNYI